MSSKAERAASGAQRPGGEAAESEDAERADAGERLVETGAAIATGVEVHASAYLVRAATRVIDAWGRIRGAERAELAEALEDAARRAGDRVASELRELLARPAADQRATPLEVVRTLPREPTEVLAAAGIPPVTRPSFDERAWPADRYDLTPRTLGDLGDPDLGPLQLAWGMAKARVLRTAP